MFISVHERTKKTFCEEIFERHYFVYLKKWCNTIIKAYGRTDGRADVQTTKLCRLDEFNKIRAII